MANSARSNSADPVVRVHAAVARALEQASTRACIAQPASVCVGLSGGLDSIVLLHALHALPSARRVRWSLDVDPVDLG